MAVKDFVVFSSIISLFVITAWLIINDHSIETSAVDLRPCDVIIPTECPHCESNVLMYKSVIRKPLSSYGVKAYDLLTSEYECDRNNLMRTGVGDGGKWVCLDHNPSTVLSLGSNGNFEFERFMSSHGSKCLTLDCSGQWHDDSTIFQKLCVDKLDHDQNGISYVSFNKVVNTFNQGKVFDVLKVDIEHFEWRIMEEVLKSGSINILMELHFTEVSFMESFVGPKESKELYQNSSMIKFIELYRNNGYLLYSFEVNKLYYEAVEISLIKDMRLKNSN